MPKYWHGRHMQQNCEMIETAVVIYKMALLSIKEIKSFITVFDLIARQYGSNQVLMSEPHSIKVLMEGLRFVNRVISPMLAMDWCLKCAPYLESTKRVFRAGSNTN